MTRRLFLASSAAVAGLRGQGAGDSVGAAYDLLYQALELLSERSTPQQTTQAIGYLRRALDQYPGFGDAHYYRYLCLKRLHQDAANALDAAERYHSLALREKRDPFTLAVPKIYDNLATVGQKWALVVGIGRFQSGTGTSQTLECAAKDAKAFRDLLIDPGIGRFPASQVFCLTDGEATTAAIKTKLDHIASHAKSDDIVLFYISTHGTSRDNDIQQVSYLYTYDTNVTSKDDIAGSALPMVEISNIISTRCTAQRTVLIFDTCHSGASSDAQTLSVADAGRLAEGAGRYILSSCEAGQDSYEDEDRQQSFFTAGILDQLRKRKGCVRLNDLFAQVQKEVKDQVRKQKGQSQSPVLFKSASAAEIVLGAAVGGTNEQCISSA